MIDDQNIPVNIILEDKGNFGGNKNDGIILVFKKGNPNMLWFVAKFDQLTSRSSFSRNDHNIVRRYNKSINLIHNKLVKLYNTNHSIPKEGLSQNQISYPLTNPPTKIFSYHPRIPVPEGYFFGLQKKESYGGGYPMGFSLLHAARGGKIQELGDDCEKEHSKAFARLVISSLEINEQDFLNSTVLFVHDSNPENWIYDPRYSSYRIIDLSSPQYKNFSKFLLSGYTGEPLNENYKKQLPVYWKELHDGMKQFFPEIQFQGSFIGYCYRLLKEKNNDYTVT